MSRTPSEVKDLVTYISQGFGELRDRARERYSQLHRDKSYGARLIKGLENVGLNLQIPFPSGTIETDVANMISVLRTRPRYHVDGGKEETRDKLELCLAHWFDEMNVDGTIRRQTWWHQAASPYACWRLSWNQFKLPADGADAYRKDYKPFSLEVLDPLTISFLHDTNGQPTIYTEEYDLPYVEVAKRYLGAESPQDGLKLLQKEFPGLRAGNRTAIDGVGDMYQKKARICLLDNGSTIALYATFAGSPEPEPEEIEEKIDNPFGQPALVLVHGRFVPAAERLVDRFKPVLDPLFDDQFNVDKLNTHAASVAISPSLWAQTLPPEVAMHLLNNPATEMPQAEFEGGIANVVGTLTEVGKQMNDFYKYLLEAARAQRDMSRPSLLITNPPPEMIQDAKANSYLGAVQTARRLYDDTIESEMAALRRIAFMQARFVCSYLNPRDYKGLDASAIERVYIQVSGNEPVSRTEIRQTGQSLSLGPSDFEDFLEGKLQLTLMPQAQTDAEKQAAYMVMRTAVADGAASHDDLLDVMWENRTEKKLQIEAERQYQKFAAMWDNFAFVADIERFKQESGGLDFSMLAAKALGADIGPPQNNGGTPQGVGGGGQPGMTPPPQPVPAARVAG